MSYRRTITILVSAIACLAALAAGLGIFYEAGPGAYEHQSIRGRTVIIYGRGIYQHMSAEVAPQGIAQDYVTLFLAIPLLAVSLWWARRGSVRGRIILVGTLAYFAVTYLFYLMMAMYNALFLVYVALLSTSAFALALVLLGFEVEKLPRMFDRSAPAAMAGGFLILNAAAIALLWLGAVVPPLVTGSIIPPAVEHYTTLVVQGLDLALLLPLGAVSGALLMRRRPSGYLLGPSYLVFLALLMMALMAKVIAMGILGYEIVPAIFIIPILTIAASVLAAQMLIGLKGKMSSEA